ncbi:hypothetical protein A2Z33_07345 [Candidatus Gottesmanbacteria bacterium RBG_16_52_11]|uniref:DUF218 domain-containing protein n=1 Tax=Candidatus Gottesmanbacteria bacterium RBG_16_52_11 TaxID=1798374 RepID=A0A1F5YYN0_9BACT|nr:MAG: hypothetical protein A2Z33_07345 [Candidatus Gottesmanbacteria bacterium RBG_16_52_11]
MRDIFGFYTVKDNPPVQTDCLIVLSYAVRKSEPTQPTKAAIRLARYWWRRFPSAFVIMSTGDNQRLGIPNSAIMARFGRKVGIPAVKIIEESKSRNTVENLRFSRDLASARGLRHVTLIMYDLHTRRALAVARKSGWSGLTWVSATGSGGPAFGLKYFQTYSRLTIFIYEITAFIYNIFRREV